MPSTATPSRLVALCFDANDPPRLARFWAEALGWAVDTIDPGNFDGDIDIDIDIENRADAEIDNRADSSIEVRLIPTDGTPFGLIFRRVTHQKSGKNRIHLDLTTSSIDDQAETVRRSIDLGASRIDIGQGPDATHVVLADPEGNEFCVIEPGNSFLAGCGRLGSITCDGSPEAGSFWSEAFGWPLVWDQNDEAAIRAPDGIGPFITWGPPIPPRLTTNRLRLEIAPLDDLDPGAELHRLVALGATVVGLDLHMVDPDGSEFSVVIRR